MKIGVKFYDYEPEVEYSKKNADFIEIMAIEGHDYSKFEDFPVPIVIHCQHDSFGVNNADKSKYDRDLRSINFALKVADSTNAEKIIVHPGELKNNDCSEENSIDLIKNIKDKRIIIENMPQLGKFKHLCSTPKEMKGFLTKTNKSFCFDVNHAIQTATDLKINYMDLCRKFLKLNPKHFHLGGQKKNGKTHLSFSESEYDFKNILELMDKDSEITLETDIDKMKVRNDLKFIRSIIS